MRDLTSRIPVELRAELVRVALVLEPTATAMRELDRLRTAVELAIDVPASLDPAELAPSTEEEFLHATRATGLDRALELAYALEATLPGLFLTVDQ
jgi:hypothetical protein